jgi:hypothetical protein
VQRVLHEVLLEQVGDEYLEEQDGVEFLIGEEESRTLAGLIPLRQVMSPRTFGPN